MNENLLITIASIVTLITACINYKYNHMLKEEIEKIEKEIKIYKARTIQLEKNVGEMLQKDYDWHNP